MHKVVDLGFGPVVIDASKVVVILNRTPNELTIKFEHTDDLYLYGTSPIDLAHQLGLIE